MKKLLGIILILTIVSCQKDIVRIQPTPTVEIPSKIDTNKITIDTNKLSIVNYQLTLSFDSLSKIGYDVSAPIIIDYDNNGRYDMIINRRKSSRTATTYSYEMLNPVVVLDNKTILEITNLWKGGTTADANDFNGDGYIDIVVMDTGPEYWDLHGNPQKTPLTVYWNNKGKFDGQNTIVKEMTSGCFCISSVDANKNGKCEIIPMDEQNVDFKYEFNGKSFDKIKITNLPNISHSPMLFRDFDRDSNIDVFSFGFSNGQNINFSKPAIILGFNFVSPQINYLPLPKGIVINSAVAADFKGNGLNDIICVGLNQGEGGMVLERKHYIFYFENMGNGVFVLNKNKLPEFIIPQNGYPMLYLAKDIDNDGDIDFYNMNSTFNFYYLNSKGDFKNGLQ